MSSVKEMMQCCQAAAFQRPHQGAEQRIRWVVMLTVVMMAGRDHTLLMKFEQPDRL